MLIEGIFAAVPTPFYPDERVYFRKIEANMAHYSRSSLAGIVILGSTGEAAMLDDEESAEVLKVAAQAAAPEKVLIAGVGRESVKATVAMAEVAASCGYDAVLVRPPSYYLGQMTSAAALNHFRSVADRSPLPLLLYNIPKFVPYQIPVEVVAELAHHPNIIGTKDSSGNMDRMRDQLRLTRNAPRRTVTVTSMFEAVTGRMKTARPEAAASFVAAQELAGGPAVATAPVKTRTREVGFQVLTGSGAGVLESLQEGASGAILAFAACAPQASYEIYQAFKDHDLALAAEKQKRIVTPGRRVLAEMGIAGLKYACDFNGFYGGRPRAPLLPLTAAEKAEVETLMAEIRN